MAYAKIPEKEAVLLVRALGLLFNQAGVYGPSHKVTQSAACTVFTEVQQATAKYGPIEISVRDSNVLVNRFSDSIDSTTGRNLREKLRLYRLGGLLFLPPLLQEDFVFCVKLFGTPPANFSQQGGAEEVLRKAALKSVRSVSVAFQRIEGNVITDDEPVSPAGAAVEPAARQTVVSSPRPAGGVGVLDLSSALSDMGAEQEPAREDAASSASERKKHAAEIAALLRDAAALLEQDAAVANGTGHQRMLKTLSKVRDVLDQVTAGSEQSITNLADQVDEDSKTIASIESAARRRGIGLKLTRGELVERYAELNQEIVQPLTVSTGVIDMLHAGKGGPLTDAQRDMLRLAAESVDRVNQLVAYMHRIAGLPASYTPDAGVITDTYR
ncbi:MAG: hypothetical protein PHG71_06350 [Kiritimatiellae bacterium]|nr:hypothetical protein [Kiritimatiellia bacterium]